MEDTSIMRVTDARIEKDEQGRPVLVTEKKQLHLPAPWVGEERTEYTDEA